MLSYLNREAGVHERTPSQTIIHKGEDKMKVYLIDVRSDVRLEDEGVEKR